MLLVAHHVCLRGSSEDEDEQHEYEGAGQRRQDCSSRNRPLRVAQVTGHVGAR